MSEEIKNSNEQKDLTEIVKQIVAKAGKKKNITYKLRIPQRKDITSLNVVKIDDTYHKIFNAYHFTNSDGYKQTDLTLELYPRVKLEEEINDKT